MLGHMTLPSFHMARMGICVLSSRASFIRIIFWSRDGVLECETPDGGPMGGKGLEDMVTAAGLWKEGELESRLDATDDGLEWKMVFRSAASRRLGLATDLL